MDDADHDGCLGEPCPLGPPFERPEWEQLQMGVRQLPKNVVELVSGHTDGIFSRPPLLSISCGVGPYRCRKSSSLTFQFRPGRRSPKVKNGNSPLPHSGPRENKVAFARDRGRMRVPIALTVNGEAHTDAAVEEFVEPELTKNASTPRSLHRCHHQKLEKVEQRSHPVYRRSCPIKGRTTSFLAWKKR